MKDSRQIEVIVKALKRKKERYLSQLARLNLLIISKRDMVLKMKKYQKDYMSPDNFTLSKSVPGLNKNVELFVKKIDAVIGQTNIEILQLERSVSLTYDQMTKVNRELELMQHFITKILTEERERLERNEQLLIDDLSALKKAKRMI